MTEPDSKTGQLVHHADDVHSDEVIYSVTLAQSLQDNHSIGSHRELVIPSSANGQLSQVHDLARPISSRELVVPLSSPDQGSTGCFNWCTRWVRSETSPHHPNEHSSLLPVYQVPSSASPGIPQRYSRYLMELLQRWLFGTVRRQYPNTTTWVMATFLTIFLISGILGLYYTGNMTTLVALSRTLACSIFRQFQPSDVALPAFCKEY